VMLCEWLPYVQLMHNDIKEQDLVDSTHCDGFM
jgi:hypothetical protein